MKSYKKIWIEILNNLFENLLNLTYNDKYFPYYSIIKLNYVIKCYNYPYSYIKQIFEYYNKLILPIKDNLFFYIYEKLNNFMITIKKLSNN